MKNRGTQDNLSALRHSLAHLLAAAVMELWPDTKRAIGPAIENGFYFDFEFLQPIHTTDLPKIEKKMREILPTWDAFTRHLLTAAQAKKEFPKNPYKHELINEFSKGNKKVSFYKSGAYWDLCRGGHVANAKEINPDAFKLTKIAGAYWRGSEKNPQLTRIYGVAFETKAELGQYLTMLEEAEKRDHRRLGRELELFFFHETAPGMPYWLPKGVSVLNTLIDFWRREHTVRGYQEIKSPLLNKKELYLTSGHWEHYLENMFVVETEEHETYALKAMNCPNAMVVFNSRLRSYRELPLRLSDIDALHRFERSGTLNGLLRVREFSQDDAHIFVSADEIESEYKNILEIAERFYSIFAMEYSLRLGTRPEKFIGEQKTWDKAELVLKRILKQSKKSFSIAEGDGAFYGPKIDIIMKDSLGRDWQMGTIQLDFHQPQRFNLKYTGVDGKDKTPVVIHRVIYGSLERFLGILIEHTAGAFPFWLAPIQLIILPLNDRNRDYVTQIASELKKHGMRIEIDQRNESIGKKIREAELQKIPYMAVIGEREVEAKTVSLRERRTGNQETMDLKELVRRLEKAQSEPLHPLPLDDTT